MRPDEHVGAKSMRIKDFCKACDLEVINAYCEVYRNKNRLRIRIVRVGVWIISAVTLTEHERIYVLLALVPGKGDRD